MTKDTQDYKNRSEGRSSHDPTALIRGVESLGIHLNEGQVERFRKYRDLLREWNARINLTSIVDPAEVEIRHFLDSLTCSRGAPDLLARPGCRVIDVGSGAGLPGVPLKIVWPSIELTLLESRGKRAEFLVALVDELQLADVTIVSERAESVGQMPEHRERYDVALARALAELPVLLELCLPLVRPGGVLIAPRGGDLMAECRAAGAALAKLGGAWEPIVPVRLPGIEGERGLVIARKIAPTPERYPRRPGMPAKRPLRG